MPFLFGRHCVACLDISLVAAEMAPLLIVRGVRVQEYGWNSAADRYFGFEMVSSEMRA